MLVFYLSCFIDRRIAAASAMTGVITTAAALLAADRIRRLQYKPPPPCRNIHWLLFLLVGAIVPTVAIAGTI